MENASKALLMAGAILIALVIIALLIRSFSTVSEFQMSQLTQEEQKQLIDFNEQYTKYSGQYVYGTEVLSLKNKYDNDKLVEVELEEGSDWPDKDENYYEYDQENNSYSNDTKYYKCTFIGYDNSTGRVNLIKFKQIKLNAGV